MGTADFRMTRQRRMILQELRKVRTHPTADEIYVQIRKIMPRISLGTVYRNLEILSEMCIIRKIEGCGNQKRFDGNAENHYHIRCMHCGKVDDLPEDVVSGVMYDKGKMLGYHVLDHTLYFNGICKSCNSRKS